MQIRGRLAPEMGAVLLKALAAARETLYEWRRDEAPEADPPTLEQQQADALALLAETALHHELDPGALGERYQVVVHVDAAVLADAESPGQSVLEDGGRVPAGASQRLACDASRVVMQHDAEGRMVEISSRTRTIPPALRRALQYRDGGGPTTLSNLAILCRRHHRAVHEEGVQVEREPNGELRFRGPAGQLLPEVPPAPWVAHDPPGVLHAWNQAAGLNLHAHTAMPGWLSERLDVGYAIDVLHPRARDSSPTSS